MKFEYAEIIHDIVDKGLDIKYLAFLIERSDTKQVCELVERLNDEKREYDYISGICKDPTIKEFSLLPIADRISEITKEIEGL